MQLNRKLEVNEGWDGSRLDTWLAAHLNPEFSRSQIQTWLKSGYVEQIPSDMLKPGQKIKAGQVYWIRVPEKPGIEIVQVDLNLSIIYEDKYLAIIHKPPGVATHPGPGDTRTSLANGIVYQWKQLMEKENTRPGVVHRLDKDTEGLMIVGLDSRIRRELMKMFANRQIDKEYRAWLLGSLPARKGRIELGIARNTSNRLKMKVSSTGRMAISDFERIGTCLSKNGRKFDFVNVNIKTGRTHQIRLHMSHLKAPVVGDTLYSKSSATYKKYGMLLYSRLLGFKHPATGKNLKFILKEPERFQSFENDMKGIE